MLDSGGISGGTNWWSLRVPEMWSMIERHDGAGHQHLIAAWKRSAELVLQHISGVQRYRESLAAAWPPERSAASAAYMERLDALILSLKDTHEAAVANHRALAGATGALDSARKTMAEIQREHGANEVLLAGYEEEKRAYQATPSKGRGVPPQSPVADGRQATLEDQARRVMSSLSSELALAQVSIIQPKLYKPPLKNDERNDPFSTSADANLPLPAATPTITSLSKLRRGTERKPRESRSVLTPRAGKPAPAPERPGPILGGHDPAGNPPPAKESIQSPSTGNPEGRPPLSGPGIISSSGGPNGLNPIQSPSTTRPSYTANHAPGSPVKNHALPPGSVIGGVPGSGGVRPPTSNAHTSQRVNPVGGLIGQPPPAPSPGRRNGEAKRELNRDHPWEITEGVEPILRPPRETKIDPGPVIGLN